MFLRRAYEILPADLQLWCGKLELETNTVIKRRFAAAGAAKDSCSPAGEIPVPESNFSCFIGCKQCLIGILWCGILLAGSNLRGVGNGPLGLWFCQRARIGVP